MTAQSEPHPNGQAADRNPRPLIAVVEDRGTLGEWLRTLSDMLRIDLYIVADAASLVPMLDRHAPLAVVCGDLGSDGVGIAKLLRLLSSYDRRTPILLVTGDDPETLGRVDAAVELWPLTRIERVAGSVRIETILDFIARAGRETGSLRLMAV